MSKPFFPCYVTFRYDPSNDDITDGMWCAQTGNTIEELQRWKGMNAKHMEDILEKRRSRYAEQLIEVDRGLFEKAKSGDVRASELLYRRFENWSPKQAEEALKRNPAQKTFAQLMEEVSRGTSDGETD